MCPMTKKREWYASVLFLLIVDERWRFAQFLIGRIRSGPYKRRNEPYYRIARIPPRFACYLFVPRRVGKVYWQNKGIPPSSVAEEGMLCSTYSVSQVQIGHDLYSKARDSLSVE